MEVEVNKYQERAHEFATGQSCTFISPKLHNTPIRSDRNMRIATC